MALKHPPVALILEMLKMQKLEFMPIRTEHARTPAKCKNNFSAERQRTKVRAPSDEETTGISVSLSQNIPPFPFQKSR
jgi:hypothetical protein